MGSNLRRAFNQGSWLVLFIMLMAAASGCGLEGEEGKGIPVQPRWPAWVFEHWVWYNESTQDQAASLVDEYQAHDIRVGAVIIDSPWATGYNTFEFDSGLYPDPQAMVDWFHGRGVRVVVWITSVINASCNPGLPCPEKALFEEGNARHYFMGDGTLIPWWKCPDGEDFCGGLIDYFNPEAVAWWHRLMDPVLDLGIDGWKCDGTDPFAIIAPVSPYAGTTHPWDYSDRYYRDFFEYTRKRLGQDRVIMARPVDSIIFAGMTLLAPFAPRDVNFAGWVGDQDSTFEGLQAALFNMYYSALARYLVIGSDIGGFGDQGRTQELFLRWAQLGAFCPLMENGGNGEHRPWMIGEDAAQMAETEYIYRRFVNIHYQLIPYLNEQAKKAWDQGISLMQVQKGEGEIWQWEFLLGEDVLVAPIYESGNFRTVHFPKGNYWVYLWDKSQVYAGGTQHTLYFPLAEFPVFLRQGSELEKARSLP